MIKNINAEDSAKHITQKISDESFPLAFIRVLGRPYLRVTALRCIASILRNFFLFQYRCALLPGKTPVTKVDHILDDKIPFLPGKVKIYLDFVAFWVRTLSFLLKNYDRRALEPVRSFIETMGGLYAHAAEVYRKNLSTTKRPFYIKTPKFLLIHAIDPHLMCVPSLHVMVVIRTYTLFRDIAKNLGDILSSQVEELRMGALVITEAVLYVKQHSVNCIPAAMYAMTRFDPRLFPPNEAESFASFLFEKIEGRDIPGNEPSISEVSKADSGLIREHIVTLYRRFLNKGETSENWATPLLDFLKELPRK